MNEIKYLKVVSIADELPKPGSSTVAFVPGEGFQGAYYNGEDTSPKWRGRITRLPIEPTHWLKPNGPEVNELIKAANDAHYLLQWFKINSYILIPDNDPNNIIKKLKDALANFPAIQAAELPKDLGVGQELLPCNILNMSPEVFWPSDKKSD